MLGHGLGGTERTFKSFDNDAAIFEVNIIQPQVTDLGGPHTVLIRHNDHGPFASTLSFCRPEHREDFCLVQDGSSWVWIACGFLVLLASGFSFKMQQYVQTPSSRWFANSFICDTANSKNATQWLVCCIILLGVCQPAPAQLASPAHRAQLFAAAPVLICQISARSFVSSESKVWLRQCVFLVLGGGLNAPAMDKS